MSRAPIRDENYYVQGVKIREREYLLCSGVLSGKGIMFWGLVREGSYYVHRANQRNEGIYRGFLQYQGRNSCNNLNIFKERENFTILEDRHS